MNEIKILEGLNSNNLIVAIALGGLFIASVYLGLIIGKAIWG